jgi:hypothetical protein
MAASMIIGVFTSIASIGLVIYSVLALQNRYWNVRGRIHYLVITVAAVAWTWFVYEWNIAGIP